MKGRLINRSGLPMFHPDWPLLAELCLTRKTEVDLKETVAISQSRHA
ncbi:hypothetical protein [Burkholderia ubonensis]|nr:hypothetical protein [Burkholderia ubonensis]